MVLHVFKLKAASIRSRVGIDNPSYKETDDVCVLKHPVTSLPPSLIWLHLEYSTMYASKAGPQQTLTTTQQSHTLVICEAGHSMTLRRLKMPKMHRAYSSKAAEFFCRSAKAKRQAAARNKYISRTNLISKISGDLQLFLDFLEGHIQFQSSRMLWSRVGVFKFKNESGAKISLKIS